jgi:hypothetical protein
MSKADQRVPSGHPVPIVAFAMWRSLRRYVLLMVLIFAGIYLTIGFFVLRSGHVKQSVVQIAEAGGPKYVLFSYGLLMLTTLMPIFVSFGVTRRHYLLANLLFSIGLTAAIAVVLTAAYASERALLATNGMLAGMPSYPLQSWGGLLPLFLQIWLVYFAHLVAAWLIAVGYWRTGPLWGTVLIPAAVVPAVGTEMLFGAEWLGTGMNWLLGTQPAPWPLATVGAVALCAVGVAIVYPGIRTVPVGSLSRSLKI